VNSEFVDISDLEGKASAFELGSQISVIKLNDVAGRWCNLGDCCSDGDVEFPMVEDIFGHPGSDVADLERCLASSERCDLIDSLTADTNVSLGSFITDKSLLDFDDAFSR